MKNVVLFILISVFIFGCDNKKFGKSDGVSKSVKKAIFEDLNSRFTGFEIAEIKNDSSNFYTAIQEVRSLSLKVSNSNVEIARRLYAVNKNILTYKEADSIYESIVSAMTRFEESKFLRPDNCFYVKYLVYKDELKIPKEEYYYISRDQSLILHRSIDWEDFLIDLKYDQLIEKALEYSGKLSEVKYELTGKF